MPNALVEQLDALAKGFARDLTAALRAATMDDVTSLAIVTETVSALPGVVARAAGERAREVAQAPVKRGRGRPPKEDSQASAHTERIVAYLRSHPGTTAQTARKALGITKPQWTTYVARAVKAGTLRKEGERRKSRYWAV